MRGIIPRSVQAIFTGVMAADENIEFTVKVRTWRGEFRSAYDQLDDLFPILPVCSATTSKFIWRRSEICWTYTVPKTICRSLILSDMIHLHAA
jgi:hypothetical protein